VLLQLKLIIIIFENKVLFKMSLFPQLLEFEELISDSVLTGIYEFEILFRKELCT
jgi:hypothetical protein